MADEIGRDLTALGGVAVLTLMTLGVVGYLLVGRKYAAASLVLLATLGGRWQLEFGVETLRRDPGTAKRRGTAVQRGHPSSSFPEWPFDDSWRRCITTLALLLTQFLSEPRLKLYLVSLAVLLMMLVGASRVYMGVHFPTDVLAGWSAGLAWALGVLAAGALVTAARCS